MSRTIITLLAAFTAFAVLTGCGGSSDSTPPTAPYLPLVIGNSWSYEVTNYQQNTATAAAAVPVRTGRGMFAQVSADVVNTAQLTRTQVVTVSSTRRIGGSDWFVALVGFTGGGNAVEKFARHNPTGLFWKDEQGLDGYYRIRNPLQVGNEWGVPFDPNNILRIAAMGETVAVPAGTFSNCIVVEDIIRVSGQPDDVLTTWYAKGTGMVKEENHLGTELISSAQLNNLDLY